MKVNKYLNKYRLIIQQNRQKNNNSEMNKNKDKYKAKEINQRMKK